MRIVVPGVASVLALLLATVTGGGQERTGLMADLIAAVAAVESKVVGLAKAMPESAYAWRPGDGVRSAGEVFIHLAGENYYAAAKFGNMTQAGTGITGAAHVETDAYEQRKMTRAQVIDAVEQSFALMKRSMLAMPDARLETMTEYSRQKVTLRSAWTRTTVHIHEHLGQLIAYARTNKIVPPWSK